jgi:hypothetical protein
MAPFGSNVKTQSPGSSKEAALRQTTEMVPFSPYFQAQLPEPLKGTHPTTNT